MRVFWCSCPSRNCPGAQASGAHAGQNSRTGEAASTKATKNWMEVWSDSTTFIRTLLVNLGVFLLIPLFIYIAVVIAMHPSAIVVGNINVSEFGDPAPYKSDDLRAQMREAFRDAYRLGGDAMPEEVVNNSIADEADQIDFEIPEIGISFSKLANYIPKLLHIDGDAAVTGKLGPTDKNEYSFKASLTDYTGTVQFEGTDENLNPLLQKAASALLRNRNSYVYASALSVKERKDCYADNRNCDFPRATLAYQSIYSRDAEALRPELNWITWLLRSHESGHYRRWALLAASKISEDQGNYENEIQLARRSVDGMHNFSWGYYNWGVALAELGCEEGAIRAFSRTISLNKNYEAAYNARGRVHLLRAEALSRAGRGYEKNEWDKAIRDFSLAFALNSDYAEAQVNLGKTYELDPQQQHLAQIEFEAVTETENAPQAARAYQQLAFMARDQGQDAKYQDNLNAARRAMADNTVCSFKFAHALLEASGCMDAPDQSPRPDKSSSNECIEDSKGLTPADSDATDNRI